MKDYASTPRDRRLRDERIAALTALPAPSDVEVAELHRLRWAREQWARQLPRRIGDARTRLKFLLRDAERFGVELETAR